MDGSFHVVGGQRAVVVADIGFVEQLAEIIVWTAETAIEDASQSCLRVAAVG